MIGIYALAVLLQGVPQAPQTLTTRIEEASVFRNGLVMVTRMAEVPIGKHSFVLDVLPDVRDGAFCYRVGEGMRVSEIRTRLKVEKGTEERKASTVSDYLFANKGKVVGLTLVRGEKTEEVKGTITSLEQSGVTLLQENGKLRLIPMGQIQDLDTASLASSVVVPRQTVKVTIGMTIETPKASQIRILTLESGAIWTGSYLLDLTGATSARIEGKAQVGISSLKFENTTLKAIAGQPSWSPNSKFDLITGMGGLKAYQFKDQERYREALGFAKDPYEEAIQAVQEQRLRDQRMRIEGPQAVTIASADALWGNANGNFGLANNREPGRAIDATMERVDNLFAYPLGTVSMEPGERLTHMLFEQPAEYEPIQLWEVWLGERPYEDRQRYDAQGQPIPVNDNLMLSALNVRNQGKVPWTDGLVMVMRDGVPNAQVTMPFTPAGRTAQLVIGTSQDVVGTTSLRQLSAERVLKADVYVNEATLLATLTVRNDRDENVRTEVRASYVGEFFEGLGWSPPTLTVTPNSRRQTITQRVSLAPKESKTITFKYKKVIN
ncbi:MAG: hypothetical protein ACOYON_10565 [Fimbriimonas sp.]